jgi:Carboxypeptidase regulatory-like domain
MRVPRLPAVHRLGRLTILSLCVRLFVFAPPLCAQASKAAIYGLILDRLDDRPIAEVRVSLSPGDIAAVTTSNGRFALTAIPYGRYVIRFERIGYETRVDSMNVGPGQPVEVTLHLATAPIELEPIRVVTRSGALDRVGFYDRRQFGPAGTFFTDVDIERYTPVQLTDLMRRAPSTIIMGAGPGRTILRFNRQIGMGGSLPGCEPAVFLDGMLIQDQTAEPRLLDFNRVPPEQVAAVEVYVGANTPIEFKRTSCGAVVIWTKRGG